MDGDAGARTNQRRRTRKDLLQAAARLARQGRSPSLEEIATEALVSRATVYRYFPSVEALLAEAALDVITPEPEALFAGKAGDDPVARLETVDHALHEVIAANEQALRVMLANSLLHRSDTPRQNRRSPLIAAALAPARRQFKPGSLDLLQKALAVMIGTEAMVVFKDVLQLDDAEARRVRRWAIRALVEAARKT
ncbi:MAG TPA: helix-turn-helix domain-containing protein [Reyranella sp.]|nr:helix-turn-helix domain-containing protein [Reyranella sp.]